MGGLLLRILAIVEDAGGFDLAFKNQSIKNDLAETRSCLAIWQVLALRCAVRHIETISVILDDFNPLLSDQRLVGSARHCISPGYECAMV